MSSDLKFIVGTNTGEVICVSSNDTEIKTAMYQYLVDHDQEPAEDFYELRSWGDYDIEVYTYAPTQLNEKQEAFLQKHKDAYSNNHNFYLTMWAMSQSHRGAKLGNTENIQVAQAFIQWVVDLETEKRNKMRELMQNSEQSYEQLQSLMDESW